MHDCLLIDERASISTSPCLPHAHPPCMPVGTYVPAMQTEFLDYPGEKHCWYYCCCMCCSETEGKVRECTCIDVMDACVAVRETEGKVSAHGWMHGCMGAWVDAWQAARSVRG